MKTLFSVIICSCFALYAHAQTGQSFAPDHTFNMNDWKSSGNANWRFNNGELSASNGSGWLFFNRSFQDAALHALFNVAPGGEAGFLFRAKQTADSTTGILVLIREGEQFTYRITLDKNGKEITRKKLRSAGSIVRIAPPPDPSKPDNNNQGARRPENTGPVLPLVRPETAFKPGAWNQVEIFLDASIIRTFLNDGRENGAATEEGYGTIGLYASDDVRFKDILLKDLSLRTMPKEQVSKNFSMQQLNDMYYAWGAAAADFNKDGKMDVVAGPYIYYGPDFTTYREIFTALAYNPSKEFTEINCQYTFDFNNDGWPDILTGPPRATVYLNPKGEPRRWDKYEVIPSVQTEITVFRDLNGDGRPELVYGAEGSLRYASFDPADPVKWTTHIVSERGYSMAHGIGTGDINSDGRIDILNPNGWWEQPARDTGRWIYHPVALARFGHRATGAGGSVMAVYDVNGDKLNDVVTGLNAHGFGLAWFEQQRNAAGEITFVQHMIMDDFSTDKTPFSQIHGTAFADIDGDGIPDFIAGKRYFSHLDNYFDPDPYGAPVIYWFKTVRDPKAPGGAKFIPEMIHNRSGAGSDILAADINNDGRTDIITSTDRGTFIFLNKIVR